MKPSLSLRPNHAADRNCFFSCAISNRLKAFLPLYLIESQRWTQISSTSLRKNRSLVPQAFVWIHPLSRCLRTTSQSLYISFMGACLGGNRTALCQTRCHRRRESTDIGAAQFLQSTFRKPARGRSHGFSICALFKILRTFFGEMASRWATRLILRPSRSQTLGITNSANSSVTR